VNILLVDDESTLRNLMKRMLQSRGFQVFDASSAEEALALSAQIPVHVLITDIVMRGMDGIALARSLGERFPDLRVLFVSGHHTEWEQERDRYRACAFLSKPFRKNDLINAVTELAADAD